MYVLMVLTFIGGNWALSMQEFASQDNCIAAGKAIVNETHYGSAKDMPFKYWCQQK
jgi:hypothetical protein